MQLLSGVKKIHLNLQNKIVKKYNIKDILFVNKLSFYIKIEFARYNKLELNKLNYVLGKCMYYKYLLINANDFKTLYNQENLINYLFYRYKII